MCFDLFYYYSQSACSLSSGLELMGLADIRLIVRLMCLSASGRVESPPTTRLPSRSGSADTVTTTHSLPLAASGDAAPSAQYLGYLSASIGALAADNPNASRLLLQLCTQVGPDHYLTSCWCLHSGGHRSLFNFLLVSAK